MECRNQIDDDDERLEERRVESEFSVEVYLGIACATHTIGVASVAVSEERNRRRISR